MNYKLLSMVISAWLSLSPGFAFGNPFRLERTFVFNGASGIATHPSMDFSSGSGLASQSK